MTIEIDLTRSHMPRSAPWRALAFAAVLVAAAPVSVIAQHQHDAKADSIVAIARQAIGSLRTADSLRAARWNALGFGGGVKDLSPFQGQHWINGPRFFTAALAPGQQFPTVDLSQPQFLMYLALGDSLVPIGVAYTKRIATGMPLPDSLAGTAAEWHSHVFCTRVPGEGNVLADGPDDCAQRGGTAAPNQIAMIHTWTVVNPDGPYAHDNPALPYLATGLRAPDNATRDDRAFAVALGETYGAKLVIAHLIERNLRRQDTAHVGLKKLAALRVPMIELVPQLRAAEAKRDRGKFAELRRKLLDGWAALAAEYRAQASTPEIRARFDYELTQALDRPHKHM